MNAHKHGSRMLLLAILVLGATGAWISGQLLKRHADLWSIGGAGGGAPASKVEGGLFERVCRATESIGLDCTAAHKSGWAELSIPVPIPSRDLSVHVRTVMIPVAFLGLAYFVFLGTWLVFVGPPRPSSAGGPSTSTIKDGQSAVDVESWHRIPLAVGWVGAAVSGFYLVVMIADIAPACAWCEAAHVVNLLMVLAIRRLYRQSCRCWIGPPKAHLRSSLALFQRKRSLTARLLTWWRRSPVGLSVPPTDVGTVPESRLAVHAVVFALVLIAGLWFYRHQQLAMGSRLHALVPYRQMVSTLRADPGFLLREYYAQPSHRIPALSDDPATEGRPRLVVFTDFQCGACYCNAMRLREQVLPAFDGWLAVDVRHYPLCDRCNPAVAGRTHPSACEAAYAAEAAGLQGGAEVFRRMHDLLFENRKKLGTEIYRELAVRIGLDAERFLRDFEGDAVRRIVQQDIELARELGVDGTPTMFLNGRRISAFGRDNPVFWRAVADDWSSTGRCTRAARIPAVEPAIIACKGCWGWPIRHSGQACFDLHLFQGLDAQ